ncbi:MAG: SIR2 family protein [Gaiellaceae bacterium]
MDAHELDSHFTFLGEALKDGSLVPLLGAGVNMSGRPTEWSEGTTVLPSGAELAAHLAAKYQYSDDESDLVRVSQFIALRGGSKRLYRDLHSIFYGEHEPASVHRLLAEIPGGFRARGEEPTYQLILTTNYDRALEHAFDDAGERYHLLWYLSEGPDNGKFMHRPPGATEAKVIHEPNAYDEVSTEDCTVIVKVHGGVADAPAADSYVITEDDYLDYLTHSTEIASLFPVHVATQLLDGASFLFLGYKLRDWNLRVILNRIWKEQTLTATSWAIQLAPKVLDRLFWEDHKVEILDLDLDEYVAELRRRLGMAEPARRQVEAGA